MRCSKGIPNPIHCQWSGFREPATWLPGAALKSPSEILGPSAAEIKGGGVICPFFNTRRENVGHYGEQNERRKQALTILQWHGNSIQVGFSVCLQTGVNGMWSRWLIADDREWLFDKTNFPIRP